MDISKKIVAVLMIVSAYLVKAEPHKSGSASEDAMNILTSATRISDFSDYRALAGIIGLDVSNPQENIAIEQGTDHPQVIGKALQVDLNATSRTAVSQAIRKAEWNGFAPSGKKFVRARLSLELDPKLLCVSRRQFLAAFAPTTTIVATDEGPISLERELAGPNRRGIAATFQAECAIKVTLFQNP